MDKDKAEGAVVLINSALRRRIVYMDKLGVCVYSVIIYRKPKYPLPLRQWLNVLSFHGCLLI